MTNNINYFKYDTSVESTNLSTHRSAVAANDAAHPTIGSGIDCGGYQTIRLYFNIGGTTPSWVVTPLFGDGSIYYEDLSSLTITKDCYVDLDIHYERDVYFLCNGSAGTSPTLTIKYRLINKDK